MSKNESLILEMLERIIKLEKEVAKLKEKQIDNPPTDLVETIDNSNLNERENKPLFIFDNKVCTRSKLVLEVIKKYVSEHSCNYDDLNKVFPKELQGAFSTIVTPDMRSSFNKEYYDIDNPIRILDGDCFVCNKWGILNIERFIDKAYEIGYKISRF